MQVPYRKLTEGEKVGILLCAGQFASKSLSSATPTDCVSAAFILFTEVQKQTTKWEEENYEKDSRAQQKRERGY